MCIYFNNSDNNRIIEITSRSEIKAWPKPGIRRGKTRLQSEDVAQCSLCYISHKTPNMAKICSDFEYDSHYIHW